ncbi:MAG: alpha/beta fold hydrolase [Candidatus Moranbacteria bacterium]|nr:alpha/beta fold hydrolase [Candidatus Moranbacteria bacterium]
MQKSKLWKGDNETVIIIIHGWTSNLKQVESLAKDLNKRGYTVFAPLLTGHGTIPEDLVNVKWEQWLDDTNNAIKKIRNDFPGKKIHLAGISLGGNLALMASLKKKVAGLTLLGTPIYLQNHFWTNFIVLATGLFKKYLHKKYPGKSGSKSHSYRYFPISSALESIKLIKRSGKILGKISAPVLVIQTSNDYMVASYSPWVVYNKIGSRVKKLHWIQVEEETHILLEENTSDYTSAINNFIKEIK